MRDRNGYIANEYNDEATPQAENAPENMRVCWSVNSGTAILREKKNIINK
jgi:hypothetical protein